MRVFIILSIVLLFISCGGSKVVIKDVLQIRQHLPEDPLAVKMQDRHGENVRIGDVILTQQSISRVQTKQMHESRYDLLLTLTGVDELRWKAYAKKRSVTDAVLLIDGRVFSVFPVVRPEEGPTIIVIDSIAATEEEAIKLRDHVTR